MNPKSELLDRCPPHNLDAEKAVLGSILLRPVVCDDVAAIVRANDFYADANRKLYVHMLAMHDAGNRIDAMLLSERLRSAGDMETIGGVAYLAEAAASVPHAGHAMYYAKIVRKASMLRAMIDAAAESLVDAYQTTDDVQLIVDRAEQRLQAIGSGRETAIVTAAETAMQVGDYVDEIIERGKHLGLPTGLPEFDERIGGLFGGELIILAARPSVGKSALAVQISDYAASTGRPTYIASLEMSGRELAMRSICAGARVNSRVIRTGRLSTDDRKALVESMAKYSREQLQVDARADLTVETLARTIRRLVRNGLQLAVVDYLGLMTPSDTSVKRYEQVSHQTRALKLLAREVQIPLLLLCQLNRQTMESHETPQLHHLRESGSIEQDADTVLFIHRPEEGILLPDPDNKRQKLKAEWPAELIVAKQRNGATGKIKLGWEPQFTRFFCWNEPREFSEFSEF